MRRSWGLSLLLLNVLALTALPSPAGAEAEDTSAVMVALGQWQTRGGHTLIVIPLEGALTTKQKNIINGGFTTVSQLTVRLSPPGQRREEDVSDASLVYKMRCSVKFDAWEESYDVARLDEAPRIMTLKQISEYGDLCLKAEISSEVLLGHLAHEGGTLSATLVVKQMSSDEAAKIKEWLIQQQSGVMQSLFSHMLGELTVNQTAMVRISIPPRPEHGGAAAAPTTKVGKLAKPALANPAPKGG